MTFMKATVTRAVFHILLSIVFLSYNVTLFNAQGSLIPSIEVVDTDEFTTTRRLGKRHRKPKSKKKRSHHADPLVNEENDGIVIYDEDGNGDYEPFHEEDEDNVEDEDDFSLDEIVDSFVPRNRINDVTQNEEEIDETEDEFSLDFPMNTDDNDEGINSSPKSRKCYGWWWGMKC